MTDGDADSMGEADTTPGAQSPEYATHRADGRASKQRTTRPRAPAATESASTAAGSLRVCLVNMPLAAIYRPSLGLSLLAAALRKAGIEVRTLYPNIWFAEYFGLPLYEALLSTRTEDALADWLFSSTAFPGFETDARPLLERAFRRTPHLSPGDRALLWSTLDQARERIPDFVAWVARETLAFEPHIVGCTSVFQQHVASLALLRRLKEDTPAVVTMMGGPNCETRMGKTTHEHFPWVDFVVSGEADEIIVDLCRLAGRHGPQAPPEDLPPGVFSPRHRVRGYPKQAGAGDGYPRLTVQDLSRTPVPDYDDFFDELGKSLFANRIEPGILFESSRGCWWGERSHCTFCGLNGGGMGYRSKTPERVLQELDHLDGRYGIGRFEAVDNILDNRYFKHLLPALEPKGYRLFFETKANLKPQQIAQLARSGIRWIQPGIESLHTAVLRLMGKGVSAWQNLQTLKFCRQHAISVSWSILSCFPGEDDAWYHEMAALIPLLHHLEPGGFNTLRYDRYSRYHSEAARFGVPLEPHPAYRAVYPLENGPLSDLVYFFQDAREGDYSLRLLNDELPGRPGLQAARRAVKAWRDGHPTARLVARRRSEALEVEDTRSCATAPSHRLSGIRRRVLEACAQAQPLRRLQDDATLGPPHQVREAVKRLQDDRLLVEVDGRLLSLVLEDPVPPLPRRHEPFGRLLTHRPA